MARVDVEEIVDHLSSEFKRALKRTIQKELEVEDPNINRIYRQFKREISRTCNCPEYVPDRCVKD